MKDKIPILGISNSIEFVVKQTVNFPMHLESGKLSNKSDYGLNRL